MPSRILRAALGTVLILLFLVLQSSCLIELAGLIQDYIVIYRPSYPEILQLVKFFNDVADFLSSQPIDAPALPNDTHTYQIPSDFGEPEFTRGHGVMRAGAASPASQSVVLLSEAFTDVAAFNPVTGALIASMPVNGNPFDLIHAPGQAQIYAVIFPSTGSGPGPPPAVDVIDAATWTIRASITLPAGTFPQYGAISPDGATLYVNNAAPAFSATPNATTSILVIDTASKKVTSTITPPSNVNAGLFGSYTRLQISPDGTLLYAVGGNAVEVIDTLTQLPVSVISFSPGLFPESSSPVPHLLFSPDGTRAYVVVSGPKGPSIQVIDTSASQVVKSIPVGNAASYLTDIDLSQDGTVIVAYDSTTASLYPVNTVNGQVGGAVSVPYNGPHPNLLFSRTR
jgi:DNA-binding beta-propeller fold protein YncE